MLTVRVKYNDGLEDLFEAESLQAVAPTGHLPGSYGPMVVDFFMSGKVSQRVESGLVFVMNDKGATVAKYDLQQAAYTEGPKVRHPAEPQTA